MLANIDKGFVELLNKKIGSNLTYQEFTLIVSERKKERDNDPVIQARRRAIKRENEAINDLMFNLK